MPQYPNFSQEEYVSTEVCNDYLAGSTMSEIANRFGFGLTKITGILNRNGIERRQDKTCKVKRTLSEEDKIDIVNRYSSGKSIAKIAIEYNISPSHVHKIIKVANVDIRSIGGPRQYFIDENLFNEIDTYNKAYALGFICADGCIARSLLDDGEVKRGVSFSQAARDRNFMKSFSSDILNSTYPIDEDGKAVLYITSKKLAENIEKYCGVTSAKSHTLQFPTCVPDNLIPAFLLGYFDGDGCWHVSKNWPIQRTISFTVTSASHEFVNKYQDILVKECGLNKTKLTLLLGTTYNMVYGGVYQTKRIYEYLYKDALFCMERKKNKVSSIFKGEV